MRRTCENAAYKFGRHQQGNLPKRRIAHDSARVCMTKRFLHFVEGMARIDEEAGESVPHICA